MAAASASVTTYMAEKVARRLNNGKRCHMTVRFGSTQPAGRGGGLTTSDLQEAPHAHRSPRQPQQCADP